MPRNPAYDLALQIDPDVFSRAQMDRLISAVREAQDRYNTPRVVCGIVATYQVRAGVDPRYRTPKQVGELVRNIIRGTTDDADLTLLYARNRRLVACAVLRGWVVGHPEPSAGWDRRVASTGTLIQFRPVYRYEQTARSSR